MINLLPDDRKAETRAARTNVLLVRYIGMLLAAVVVLGGLVGGSYFVLQTTKESSQSKADVSNQRVNEYIATKQKADQFRSDLATAKTILGQKTSFAKLIYKIANIIPPNVVLDSLTLDPKTFGSKMAINASAKTFDDATKLRESFKKNQNIFLEVQLQSIQSGTAGDTTTNYPVKVVLSVIINKGAVQ